MNEKNSTTNTEFNELKKLLKEIPKVKAPDNFEFNLMTKIQNKNFEIKSEKKKSIFSWALTPAIGFAATVFIVIFLFSFESEVGDDPWQITPKLIQENAAELKVGKSQKNNIASEKAFVAKSSAHEYPLAKGNSISLDEDMKISNKFGNTGKARLASANDGLPFDGFYIREIEKHEKVDTTNSMKDSTTTR